MPKKVSAAGFTIRGVPSFDTTKIASGRLSTISRQRFNLDVAMDLAAELFGYPRRQNLSQIRFRSKGMASRPFKMAVFSSTCAKVINRFLGLN